MKRHRVSAALVTTGALLASTVGIVGLVATPAGAATTSTAFTNQCRALATINVDKSQPTTLYVDGPATVNQGDNVTFRIQPSPGALPDKDSGATTTNLSRMKWDYEIPSNATFVSASVVARQGDAQGYGSTPDAYGNYPGGVNVFAYKVPSVIRVNAAGTPDAAGTIIRLAGNNETIGNSPSVSTNSEGGIGIAKNKKNLNGTNSGGDTWFQPPAIDVTVTATGAPGSSIQPKVRQNFIKADAMNFSTQLAKASFSGVQWARTYCRPTVNNNDGDQPPNAGGGPLASTTITASSVATTTALTAPATATTGTPVNLSASISPSPGAVGTVQFKENGTNIGSPVAVSGGTANVSWTPASTGSRSITAAYSGGTGFDASTSAASSVTVSAPNVNTTTALTAPATATTGTPVNLSASVSPSPGAVGTVQFKENGTNIGSPVAVSGGTANVSWTPATAGSRSITAVYSGGTGFNGSTSAASTVTVSSPNVNTTTALTAPATATTGTPVNLSASTSPSAGSVGTVQFKDGATNIGSPVALSGGSANVSWTPATIGSHAITAVYSGGTGFNGSTSAVSNVTVSTNTTTSLSAPATADNGTPVDLTATVSPAAATGSVQFMDGASTIGSPVAVAAGSATLSHTFTSDGPHSITAVFTGTGGYNNSTSSSSVVNVSTPAEATSTVFIDGNDAPSIGTPANYTVSVTPNPTTGTVQFFIDGVASGTPVALDVDGNATIDLTFDSLGSHAVTAAYSGTPGFLSSVSTSFDVVVGQAAPVLQAGNKSAVNGSTVTIDANLVGGYNATGTVQFTYDGNPVGGPVALVAGSASVTVTATGVGGHLYGAVYSGDTNNAGAAAVGFVAVSAANAVSSTVGGSFSITGDQGEFVVPFAPGSSLESELNMTTFQYDLGGVLEFTPTALDASALGATVYATLAQVGPLTGTVDGNTGVASLSTSVDMRLDQIELAPNPPGPAAGGDCVVGPIQLDLTGTMVGNTINLTQNGFTIPELDANACNGLGGIMNMFFAGTTTISLDLGLPAPTTFTGTVTDSSNNAPIAGALVYIFNGDGSIARKVSTDVNGVYTIDGVYSSSTFDWKVIRAGYTTILPGSVSTDPGNTVTTGFALAPTTVIRGTVTLEGAGVAANQKVTLFDSTQTPVATVKTNANGEYRFTSVAEGQYKLRFIAPAGYNWQWYGSVRAWGQSPFVGATLGSQTFADQELPAAGLPI